jgi:hypothetical protein
VVVCGDPAKIHTNHAPNHGRETRHRPAIIAIGKFLKV